MFYFFGVLPQKAPCVCYATKLVYQYTSSGVVYDYQRVLWTTVYL